MSRKCFLIMFVFQETTPQDSVMAEEDVRSTVGTAKVAYTQELDHR